MKNTSPAISPAYSKLLGKSYAEMNCWKAVKEFYLLQANVDLSGIYDEEEPPVVREKTEQLILSSKGKFEEIPLLSKARFGDLLLFEINGIESHIGVYVNENQFFHSSKSSGVVLDRIWRWTFNLSGIYRLPGAFQC